LHSRRSVSTTTSTVPLAYVFTDWRMKVTADRNETFESWRERDHDDLVLALALALHVANVPPVSAVWVDMNWQICVRAKKDRPRNAELSPIQFGARGRSAPFLTCVTEPVKPNAGGKVDARASSVRFYDASKAFAAPGPFSRV
jgi:hypothetical protein